MKSTFIPMYSSIYYSALYGVLSEHGPPIPPRITPHPLSKATLAGWLWRGGVMTLVHFVAKRVRFVTIVLIGLCPTIATRGRIHTYEIFSICNIT